VQVSPIVWVDGKRAEALPLPDRGLELGDGLFETILFYAGQPLYLDLHLERLQCGLNVLGFDLEASGIEPQLQPVTASIKERGWMWSSVRVTITRGSGPRGYAPPKDAHARVVLQAYEMKRNAGDMLAPLELDVAELRLSSQPALAGLKHLNRLEQILAAREARQRSLDDLLMMNQSEGIVSVIAGNIFVVQGDRLMTPPIEDSGIAGTRRRLIIEQWGPDCGFDVAVAPLRLVDVLDAREVFCSSSLVTVRPISRIGEQFYSSSGAAEALFSQFAKHLQ